MDCTWRHWPPYWWNACYYWPRVVQCVHAHTFHTKWRPVTACAIHLQYSPRSPHLLFFFAAILFLISAIRLLCFLVCFFLFFLRILALLLTNRRTCFTRVAFPVQGKTNQAVVPIFFENAFLTVHNKTFTFNIHCCFTSAPFSGLRRRLRRPCDPYLFFDNAFLMFYSTFFL